MASLTCRRLFDIVPQVPEGSVHLCFHCFPLSYLYWMASIDLSANTLTFPLSSPICCYNHTTIFYISDIIYFSSTLGSFLQFLFFCQDFYLFIPCGHTSFTSLNIVRVVWRLLLSPVLGPLGSIPTDHLFFWKSSCFPVSSLDLFLVSLALWGCILDVRMKCLETLPSVISFKECWLVVLVGG